MCAAKINTIVSASSVPVPMALPKRPTICQHLNYLSVKALCGESKQAMVYGFERCAYQDVADVLGKFYLEKVFNWFVGDPTKAVIIRTTIEGRVIEQLPIKPYPPSELPAPSQRHKAGLSNIVLENYKRAKVGLPLIPIIFCVDIDSNSRPIDIEILASNQTRYTFKELRRAYKLICEFDNPELRRIALATFKFVKLTKEREASYKLDLVPAPWANVRWKELWAKRKAKAKPPKAPAGEYNWRKNLASSIRKFDHSRCDRASHLMERAFRSVWARVPSLHSLIPDHG